MNAPGMKRFRNMAEYMAVAAMLSTPIRTCAQTAGQPMSFDVALIRQNVDNIGTCSPDQVQPTPNGFHMTNCPLLMVVGAAYIPTSGDPLGYLVQERILGMPRELSQERYNIEARIADSDAAAWRDPVQRTNMLACHDADSAVPEVQAGGTSRNDRQAHFRAADREEWTEVDARQVG